MKTNLKRFIAGSAITILASAFSACSPTVIAPSRPRPVVYVPAPPPPPPIPAQTIPVMPVVPVWAPPYTYVTEVHYYYFPDYSVYYDVFKQHYCYFDGFSWLHVSILPSMPGFYGFNPYNAYIVVLNQSAYQPWIKHDYYSQQYPTGYYKNMYSPRTSLGSNTVLRAYDENRSQPVFVDKRSNKEVAVKYDVRPSRTSIGTNSITRNPPVSSSQENIKEADPRGERNGNTVRPGKNNSFSDQKNGRSLQQHNGMDIRSPETTKQHDPRQGNANANANVKSHTDVPNESINSNQPIRHSDDSRKVIKNSRTTEDSKRVEKENTKANRDSRGQNNSIQSNRRSR